jgi:hypothetical protein
VADPGRSIDAQALRLAVHGDEQQAYFRVDQHVTQALEHAVAVIIREGQLRRARDRDEPGHAALEGAIWPSIGVGRREKEVRSALDECPVIGRKLRAAKTFQAIGNSAAVKLILQPAVSFVKHDAVGHHRSPWSMGVADIRHSRARVAGSRFWRNNPATEARTLAVLFDHLVGTREKTGRHSDSEHPGGLHIDDQFEFGWLQDR